MSSFAASFPNPFASDFYDRFGVDPDAPMETITDQYMVLEKRHRQNEAALVNLKEAYDMLRNHRRKYDETRPPKPFVHDEEFDRQMMESARERAMVGWKTVITGTSNVRDLTEISNAVRQAMQDPEGSISARLSQDQFKELVALLDHQIGEIVKQVSLGLKDPLDLYQLSLGLLSTGVSSAVTPRRWAQIQGMLSKQFGQMIYFNNGKLASLNMLREILGAAPFLREEQRKELVSHAWNEMLQMARRARAPADQTVFLHEAVATIRDPSELGKLVFQLPESQVKRLLQYALATSHLAPATDARDLIAVIDIHNDIQEARDKGNLAEAENLKQLLRTVLYRDTPVDVLGEFLNAGGEVENLYPHLSEKQLHAEKRWISSQRWRLLTSTAFAVGGGALALTGMNLLGQIQLDQLMALHLPAIGAAGLAIGGWASAMFQLPRFFLPGKREREIKQHIDGTLIPMRKAAWMVFVQPLNPDCLAAATKLRKSSN